MREKDGGSHFNIDKVSRSNLSYKTFPVDNDESVTHIVRQVRKNFALFPWAVSSSEYGVNCKNSIKGGENKTCVITIWLP